MPAFTVTDEPLFRFSAVMEKVGYHCAILVQFSSILQKLNVQQAAKYAYGTVVVIRQPRFYPEDN